MNLQTLNYIAVLGFAGNIQQQQISIVREIAAQIVAKGFGVAAGNLTGTFYHAFRQAKSCSGYTVAIVEQSLSELDHQYCDILQVVSSTSIKHKVLADHCVGGIVVGGGSGTAHVIKCFLKRRKKIIAITGTGGIVSQELDSRVVVTADVNEAVEILTKSDTNVRLKFANR